MLGGCTPVFFSPCTVPAASTGMDTLLPVQCQQGEYTAQQGIVLLHCRFKKSQLILNDKRC